MENSRFHKESVDPTGVSRVDNAKVVSGSLSWIGHQHISHVEIGEIRIVQPENSLTVNTSSSNEDLCKPRVTMKIYLTKILILNEVTKL